MRFTNLKKLVAGAALGFTVLLGTAEISNAQSNRNYRQWEKEQRRVEKQQQKAVRQQQKYERMQYRVYNNGRYYQTDNRGIEILRQAVNSGYQQGYYAGQTGRRNGNRYGYNGLSSYRNGTYGYSSYVDQSQYRYYFQQGFQRGYEDGYNSRYQYGYNSGGGLNILGSILQGILNFSQF